MNLFICEGLFRTGSIYDFIDQFSLKGYLLNSDPSYY